MFSSSLNDHFVILIQINFIIFKTKDLPSVIKYTTRLLRKLFTHLPREEQHRLLISLPRVVNSAKKQGVDIDIKYWGINIVRGIQVCRYVLNKSKPLFIFTDCSFDGNLSFNIYSPTSRKIPYPNTGKPLALNAEGEANTNDGPFIYNPFNKKAVEEAQVSKI